MDRSQHTAPYFDSRELRAELTANFRASGDDPAKARPAMIERLKALVADAARGSASPARGRRQRAPLRGRAVALPGRADPRPLRLHGRARLPRDQPFRRRAHGDRRHRRLRPRAAGAGLRHRSAVPASLQEDARGARASPSTCSTFCGISASRSGTRRAPSISASRSQRRHHHAHGAARRAADPRRRPALWRVRRALPHRGGAGYGARLHRRQDGRAR